MAGINHEAVKTFGEKGEHTEWNADHVQRGNHDCEQHQFLNEVIENRTDFPAGPVAGQIVYRSDEGMLWIYNGTNWEPYLGKVDSCFCYLLNPSSIQHNQWTNINWSGELWDNAGLHNPAVNPERITLSKAGFWDVKVHIAWEDNAVGYRGVTTIVNNCDRGGSSFSAGANASPYGYFQELCFTLKADEGGWFRILVLQGSGGALNVQSSNLLTNIQVTYLGAEGI